MAAAFAISKRHLFHWAHAGHCNLLGNELTNAQAKLGTAEAQPDTASDTATRRAFISHVCFPAAIQHPQVKRYTLSFPKYR